MSTNGNGAPRQIQPLGLVAAGSPLHVDVQIGHGSDGQSFVMLRLETVVGSWCQPLPAGLAKALGELLIAKATEADSGVVVPIKNLIVPPSP